MDEIKNLKELRSKKNHMLAFIREKNSSFEYDVLDMLKNKDREDWNKTMEKTYKEYFEKNIIYNG